MKAIKKSLLAAALASALGFGISANANTIDLFEDPMAEGVNNATISGAANIGNTASSSFGSATTILGGYRDLVVELIASNGVGTPRVEMEVSGGGLSFSTSDGDQGRGTVQWDGNDGSGTLDPTGLQDAQGKGANLIIQEGCPVGGCDRFLADVLSADLAFAYSIGIYTDANNYSILTANTLFPVVGETVVDYLFSWFLLPDGPQFEGGLPFTIQSMGTVDFTDVGAIEFIVNSDGQTIAVDLALAGITKTGVPEPGALALVGVALLGAGLAGRRRKALKA